MQKKWAALVCAGVLALSVGHCVPCMNATAEAMEQGESKTAWKRDPNAGYYELLDAESYFDFCTWLVDKKGLDLNDEQDSVYIGSNFNPLLFEAIDEGVIHDITNPNLRWYFNQHTYVPFYAMDGLLANDGKAHVRNFFNQAAGNGTNYFSCMVDGFYAPDRDENQNLSEGHFYGWNTHGKGIGNYRSGVLSYDISARTRLEQHYHAAIQAWKAGYKISAMDELGRAIHYLCDMGQPLHANVESKVAMLGNVNKHLQYETWVDTVQANVGPSQEDADVYDYWLGSANYNVPGTSTNYYSLLRNQSFETICDTITSHAYGYASAILRIPKYSNSEDLWNNSEAISVYDEATDATLPVVQGVVAGILNRFYEEVQLSQTIQNNGIYRIQNVSTGKYLNVTNGSITVKEFSSSADQKFRLEYRENSSDPNKVCRGFAIYSLSSQKYLGNYLTNGLEVKDMTSFNNDYNFLPVSVTGDYFRIMHDGEAYLRNVIGVGNEDWIWRQTNNSESNLQLWEFIAA